MTHGQPHEEAEHAAHHAADPFDKRVAMSMVVIAAVLAAVKVLGHRTHNETLQYQIMAGVEQSKAGTYHTQEADQWNFFQAKKMREVLAELRASLSVPELKAGKTDAEWQADIEKNLKETISDLDKPPEAKPLGSVEDQAKKALERAAKERRGSRRSCPGSLRSNWIATSRPRRWLSATGRSRVSSSTTRRRSTPRQRSPPRRRSITARKAITNTTRRSISTLASWGSKAGRWCCPRWPS